MAATMISFENIKNFCESSCTNNNVLRKTLYAGSLTNPLYLCQMYSNVDVSVVVVRGDVVGVVGCTFVTQRIQVSIRGI